MRSPRCLAFVLGLFLAAPQFTHATDTQHKPQQSGISWAQQAMLALTGGVQVNSVSENGSVTWTFGNNQGTGNIAAQSAGNSNSQVTLSTTAGNRSESRSWASDGSGPVGQWTDLQGNQHQMVQHNCWSDAVWFFPALSLLSDTADPTLVFVDIGPEQHDGHNVEHIQAYRTYPGLPSDVAAQIQQMTAVNYYLDSGTALPVALTFSLSDDHNMNATVLVEIVFSQYQQVNGILVPFQVTRLHAGNPLFQITISSVTVH